MGIYIKSGNRSQSKRIDDGYKKRHQLDISLPPPHCTARNVKSVHVQNSFCAPSILFLIVSLRNHEEVQNAELKGPGY